MKRLITVILMIMLAATASATDLADYPDFFIKNNKFNGIIVIGEDAPAEDVVSAIDISSAFPVKVGASYLDSEIRDVTDYNAIVVGNPCVNSAAAELESLKGSKCDKWIEDGKGYIKLYKHGNRVQILVTGLDSSDRRAAAHVLARHNEYDLEGHAMEVDGWLRAPKKYTSHVPYDNDDSDDYDWVSYDASLDDYPEFLLDSNEFDGYFVVGANAPASDVVASIDIQTGISQKKVNGKYPQIPVDASRLDTEIADITSVNAIVVGHPVENTAAKDLYDGFTIETGKGYIKVYRHGSKYQVLVTGQTELDRRKAARALAQYKNFDFDGQFAEVTGTSLTDLDIVYTKQMTSEQDNELTDQGWTEQSYEPDNDSAAQKNMVVQQEYTYKEPEHEVELIIHNPAPETAQEPQAETGIIDSMWETVFGWI